MLLQKRLHRLSGVPDDVRVSFPVLLCGQDDKVVQQLPLKNPVKPQAASICVEEQFDGVQMSEVSMEYEKAGAGKSAISSLKPRRGCDGCKKRCSASLLEKGPHQCRQ